MSENTTGEKIVSGMFWRFGEKITAQGVSFIVSLVLARLLMPDDYGIVAIVTVFTSIAEVFVTSGLGTALIQKKNVTTREFSTLFWCNLILAFGLYAIVFFAAPFIAQFYDMPLLTTVLRVLSIKLPLSAINSIQNAYVSRHMDFKKFFFATIIGTIISAFVGVSMAYAGYGVWALICQILTNNVIDTFVLFLTIAWKPTLEFSFKEAKPLFSYGWKILATDFIGTIFNNLNSFIIGKKYTSGDLGFYTKGKAIPDMVNGNIGNTLSAVLFPAMSLSTGTEAIKQMRRRCLKMMGYVIFPMAMGMIAVADKMIVFLYTEKWSACVPYLRIACVCAILDVLGTTLIQETKSIGRSDMTLKMELIKKPIFLAITIFAMQFGPMAIALTLPINGVIAFCFNVYPVRKYIGFDFKMHLKDLLPAFFMSFTMMVIVLCVGMIIPGNVLCLFVQILVGVIVYVGLSLITKNEDFVYLKELLLRRKRR